MGIFSAEDEQRIRSIHEQRAEEDKRMFFDYFCDKAVETIVNMIAYNRDVYLQQFEEHARTYSTRHTRSIPIMKFSSFEHRSISGKLQRRYAQDFNLLYETPGSYYTSLSGLHIVDLSAIYRNSEFRERVNAALGSNAFTIHLVSKVDAELQDVRSYTNTLFLNINI